MLVKFSPTTMPIKGPIKGPFAKPIKGPFNGPIKGPIKRLLIKQCPFVKPVPKGWIHGHGPYIYKYGPDGKLIIKPWPYKPMTYWTGGPCLVKPIGFGKPIVFGQPINL